MTDSNKYKSIAIDKNCYKKIENLSTSLIPGVILSRAQVIRTLVNQRLSSKKNINQKIIGLFSEYTPQERQKILEDIDKKILNLLKLNSEDLPWHNNPREFESKWISIMEDIRLIVSKFKYDQLQNDRSVN